MAGQALSPQERRILTALENELRRDRDLDFALRTMLVPRPRLGARLLERCGRMPFDWIVLLVACGLALATVAVEVHTARLVVSAAAFWVVVALLETARVRGRRRLPPDLGRVTSRR